jgi:c-di-GMP-binding flagellar brake protein YcgR
MPDAVQEDRKFYRFPVSTPIQYVDTRVRKPDRGYTCDISEGGVCFLANRSMAKGEMVQVSVPVDGEIFKRTGKVAYSNHVASMDLYRTGVEFNELQENYDRKLNQQSKAIRKFQRELSLKYDRAVSEDEAARAWVEKYMQQFSNLF